MPAAQEKGLSSGQMDCGASWGPGAITAGTPTPLHPKPQGCFHPARSQATAVLLLTFHVDVTHTLSQEPPNQNQMFSTRYKREPDSTQASGPVAHSKHNPSPCQAASIDTISVKKPSQNWG